MFILLGGGWGGGGGGVIILLCVTAFVQTGFRSKPKETQLRASNKNAADKHQSESSSSSCDSEEDEDLTRKVDKFTFKILRSSK